jgi:hypothetical protein
MVKSNAYDVIVNCAFQINCVALDVSMDNNSSSGTGYLNDPSNEKLPNDLATFSTDSLISMLMEASQKGYVTYTGAKITYDELCCTLS